MYDQIFNLIMFLILFVWTMLAIALKEKFEELVGFKCIFLYNATVMVGYVYIILMGYGFYMI